MSAITLLYHRVAQPQRDPQLLCVSAQNFATQLRVIREFASPAWLHSLFQTEARAREEGTELRPASACHRIAVTFDDGYSDNISAALPLLAAEEIPATFLIATGFVGKKRLFFWDELDALLLGRRQLPQRLRMEVGDGLIDVDLGEAALPDDANRHAGWNVTLAPPTARHALYLQMCEKVRLSTAAARESALAFLREWAGPASGDDAAPHAMSCDELAQAASSPLVEIAAHTVDHPLLAVESEEEQRRQLCESKSFLERSIGRPVRAFSYPFGTRRDYTAVTRAAVADAGFALACSNFQGIISPQADPLQIPRFIVRDWGADEFRRQLAGWLSPRG